MKLMKRPETRYELLGKRPKLEAGPAVTHPPYRDPHPPPTILFSAQGQVASLPPPDFNLPITEDLVRSHRQGTAVARLVGAFQIAVQFHDVQRKQEALNAFQADPPVLAVSEQHRARRRKGGKMKKMAPRSERKHESEPGLTWDEVSGGFSHPEGHVNVGKLLFLAEEGHVSFPQPHAEKLLWSAFNFVKPEYSDWNQPMIRLFSEVENSESLIFDIKFHVYFTRMVFELVSSDSFAFLMKHIVPAGRVQKTTPMKSSDPTYTRWHAQDQYQLTSSTMDSRLDDACFSYSSILKAAELCTYPIDTLKEQPRELKVKLYPYQRESVQFLLDRESDERGLNGLFWEKWSFLDAQDDDDGFYYFILGEVRFESPPITRGGLLCEEMGLGKTVEILALILENRRLVQDGQLHYNSADRKYNLIVAPASLLGQWEIEIKKCVGDDLKFCIFTHALESSLHKWAGNSSLRFYDEWDKASFDLDVDIVLASYEMLVKRPKFFHKIPWLRIILDECQQIRNPATKIASVVANLKADYRWMVSGTPIVRGIDDLYGELNFLQVWPFCTEKDDFWEAVIRKPWENRSPEALIYLQTLLSRVMIRHSKSQTYMDGSPLLALPTMNINIKPLTILSKKLLYLYHYLELMATKELTYINEQRENSKNREKKLKKPNVNLKALLGLMSRILLDPTSVPLPQLDHIHRTFNFFQTESQGLHMLLDRHETNLDHNQNQRIRKVKISEILRYCQSMNASKVGGLNRDVNRTFAMTNATLNREREKYESLSMKQLRQLLLDKKLPIPMTWTAISGYSAIIEKGDQHAIVESTSELESLGPLTNIISVGCTVRFNDHIGLENLRIVTCIKKTSETAYITATSSSKAKDVLSSTSTNTKRYELYFDKPWNSQCLKIQDFFIGKETLAKKRCVDLLVSLLDNQNTGIHQTGFDAIYSMMRGKEVLCPICLEPAHNPCITLCVHLYCMVCMEALMKQKDSKCAICRRSIPKEKGAMEVDMIGYDEEDDIFEPTVNDMETGERRRAHLESHSTSELQVERKYRFCPSLDKDDIHSFLKDYIHEIDDTSAYTKRVAPSLSSEFLNTINSGTLPLTEKLHFLRTDINEGLQSDTKAKFIIFSQYSKSLHVVSSFLKLPFGTFPPIEHVTLSGDMDPQARVEAITLFNNNPDCKVFLTTMGSGSSGLTLTVANVVYFLEPTLNIAEETQALARAHRIGQEKSVRCEILYMEGTVEERILALREREKTLNFEQSLQATANLDATDTKDQIGTLSIDHLELIFGMRTEV